ncbi:Ig-like domain-containing protein [Bacillus dakarensis]|uniref:Ig-like domain-containing protein n=1 Tax=Robertmurraya dakarensis TaxID=1926278 RepID=UPI000980AAEA|nr:Ig-like domain-containing protein [Bacillus dakarensis]
MSKTRAPFSFIVTVLLLFSSFLSVSASAQTSPTNLWKVEYEGEPLFDPLLDKDQNLIVGKYSIIDGVYHNDFMTIDNTNGEVLDQWKLTGRSNSFSDEDGDVYIHILDTETSKFSLYTNSGEKLWEKTLNMEEHYYYVVPGGNQLTIIDHVNREAITYSINGEELSRETLNDQWATDIYYIWDNYSGSLSFIQESPNGETLLNKELDIRIPEGQIYGGGDVQVSENNRLFVILSLYDDVTFETTYKLLVLDKQGNQIAMKDLPYSGGYDLIHVNENIHLMFEGTYLVFDGNGSLLNEYQLFNDDNHYVTSVRQIDDEHLYLFYSDFAVLVTLDGEVIWKKEISSNDDGYWNVYDILEDIYLYSGSDITSYDKDTGNQNWQYTLNDEGYLAALLVDEPNGKVYYQTRQFERIPNGEEYDFKYSTTISAFSFSDSQPSNAVSKDKPWTIEFNSNIDRESVNAETIYIVDSNGEKVSGLEYKVNENKVVVLAPKEGYTSKESYKLVITQEVKSVSQKELKEIVKKEFTIK